MSRLLNPFAELPLKLLAFDTIDNRNVSLQLPAVSPPGTSASTATPLEPDTQPRLPPFTEFAGWHHGGLNE
jgi:hypothetical protein